MVQMLHRPCEINVELGELVYAGAATADARLQFDSRWGGWFVEDAAPGPAPFRPWAFARHWAAATLVGGAVTTALLGAAVTHGPAVASASKSAGEVGVHPQAPVEWLTPVGRSSPLLDGESDRPSQQPAAERRAATRPVAPPIPRKDRRTATPPDPQPSPAPTAKPGEKSKWLDASLRPPIKALPDGAFRRSGITLA